MGYHRGTDVHWWRCVHDKKTEKNMFNLLYSRAKSTLVAPRCCMKSYEACAHFAPTKYNELPWDLTQTKSVPIQFMLQVRWSIPMIIQQHLFQGHMQLNTKTKSSNCPIQTPLWTQNKTTSTLLICKIWHFYLAYLSSSCLTGDMRWWGQVYKSSKLFCTQNFIHWKWLEGLVLRNIKSYIAETITWN